MKGDTLKDSDFKQAERILRLIRQLTAEELSSIEIISDNPDGPPDCAITRCEYLGANHPGTDDEGNLIETFHGETLLECLLKAMSAKGLDEDPNWGPVDASQIVPDLKAAVEQATGDVGLRYEPSAVTFAAVKALELWARCKAGSETFNGGATVGFRVAGLEMELTIKPKRTGFAFVETADSIENDRAGEPQFGEPLSIEDELAAVLGMGSPVQDLRGEYAAAYHRAHLEAIQEVGRCEGCGITKGLIRRLSEIERTLSLFAETAGTNVIS